MSIHPADRLRPATFRVSLPLCAAAAVYALLVALGGRLLNDPDIYWHLAAGRWIVAHREFPHADVFSQTVAGAPWIATEWLSQLLYAGAHAVAGWSGVVVLAAMALTQLSVRRCESDRDAVLRPAARLMRQAGLREIDSRYFLPVAVGRGACARDRAGYRPPAARGAVHHLRHGVAASFGNRDPFYSRCRIAHHDR